MFSKDLIFKQLSVRIALQFLLFAEYAKICCCVAAPTTTTAAPTTTTAAPTTTTAAPTTTTAAPTTTTGTFCLKSRQQV